MITQRLFLYLFAEVYDILVLRFIPAILRERGVEILAYLMAFLVAVAANLASDIMSRFICKWLDRYDDDRKPN